MLWHCSHDLALLHDRTGAQASQKVCEVGKVEGKSGCSAHAHEAARERRGQRGGEAHAAREEAGQLTPRAGGSRAALTREQKRQEWRWRNRWNWPLHTRQRRAIALSCAPLLVAPVRWPPVTDNMLRSVH